MNTPAASGPQPMDDGPDGPQASAEHIATRADALLPEERTVGSDDPEAQAEVLLEDSDARTHEPNAAPSTHLERRTSRDTA